LTLGGSWTCSEHVPSTKRRKEDPTGSYDFLAHETLLIVRS
jgi:hypothetical protein